MSVSIHWWGIIRDGTMHLFTPCDRDGYPCFSEYVLRMERNVSEKVEHLSKFKGLFFVLSLVCCSLVIRFHNSEVVCSLALGSFPFTCVF